MTDDAARPIDRARTNRSNDTPSTAAALWHNFLEPSRARLLRRIRASMGSLVARVCEPEDVLQDALMKRVEVGGPSSVDCNAHEQAWILAAARHRILDVARHNHRRERPQFKTPLPSALIVYGMPCEELVDERAEGPTDAADHRDRAMHAVRALSRLAPRQRLCIVLRDLLELPWSNVAFALRCPRETAMKLHSHARRRLARDERTTPA